jgi:hypothetical protein
VRSVVARSRALLLTAAVFAGTAVALPPPASATPVAAIPDEAHDEATAAAFARQGDKQVVVTSKTTETSETAANPDGSWTLTQYAHPVRVKQGADWTPIDTTLVRKPDGSIGPKAVTIDVTVNPGGAGSASTPIVLAGQESKEIGLNWASDLPKPSLSGDTATYAEVLPGVDLTVRAMREGYVENLVIKTPQAAQNPKLRDVPFGLHTENTTVSKVAAPAEGLEVKDDAGAVVFAGDASRMWDSSGTGSEAEAQLGEGGGRRVATMDVALTADKVTISPDQAFLADPATKYPVSLDPDYWCTSCGKQAHAVVQDGYPEAHNYNVSAGKLSDLKAGFQNDDSSGLSRTYLQMNTRPIWDTVVKSATLNTTVIHSYNCQETAQPTQLLLSNGFDGNITWNNQPGWPYGLGESNVANCKDAPNVTATFDATTAIRDAAASHWNSAALVLKAKNESRTVAAWRRFGLDPSLQINYNSRPNLPVSLSMQNGLLPCVSGPNRPWVYTKTPQLAGRVSDPDGGTLFAKFAVAYGALGHNVYIHDNGANLVTVGTPGQNQQATAQMAALPGGWINEDGIYNWSAQVTDGELWSNWNGNCEFTVDSKPPLAPSASLTNTPATQGDDANFTVQVGMATAGLYDIDRFIYTTDGSEPQPLGSPTAPATQGTDSTGKLTASTTLKTTAVNGNQNLIRVKAVNKAGTPGPNATCVASPVLDAPSCSYHVQPITPGKNLAAAWSADETSGTTLADTAADTPTNGGIAAHPATTTGGATWTAGYDHGNSWTHPDVNGYSDGAKGALNLDGGSGYAMTSGPVIDTSKSFTVSAWTKLTDTNHSQSVIAQDGVKSGPFFLQYNKESNAWAVRVTAGDQPTPSDIRAVSASPPQLGVWTHLTATYDASTNVATLYVDGAKQNSVVVQAWQGTGPMVLGASKWDSNHVDLYHGQIDDAAAWQRTLSAQDVHDLANTPAPLANYSLAEGCAPELTSATSKVPSLQGNWALGESSGNLAQDTSTRGNPVTLTGGYAWGPGRNGGGLHLDGITGTGAAAPVIDTSNSFTVSTWVKPDDLNGTYTVASQRGSKTAAFLLRYSKDTNRWAFGMNPADDAAAAAKWATGTSTPQAGAWTLLTGTFDRTSMQIQLYVNGKREAQTGVTTSWNATGNLVLGSESGATNFLKGTLDQTQVWDRILTADQIASMNGYSYYDSVAQNTGVAAGGVALQTTKDGAGKPTGCAAEFDKSWTGQVAGPRPSTLRTDKSFTVESWARHTWTAADVTAEGAIDPSVRAVAGVSDAQYSPFLLGYRPWTDPAGKKHGKWSVLLSSSPTDNGGWYALSDTDVVDNTWTHLAATYDASTKSLALYVNGTKQNTYLNTPDGGGATGRNSQGELFLGRGIWGGNRSDEWYGGVAGVRVYAGVRRLIEIGGDARSDDPRLLFSF